MSGISSSQSSSDYFGVSSGSSLLTDLHIANSGSFVPSTITHLQAPTFGSSLTGPERHYNLGVDLTFQAPHTTFSVASVSTLNAELRTASEPSFTERFTRAEVPNSAVLGLTVDLATKSTRLSPLTTAIDLAKGINDINTAVKQSGENGISDLEAGACKAVNVAMDIGVIAIGTEAFLWGLTPLVAVGVANPPLGAAMATTAAVALPTAAANLGRLGTVAGEIAEEKCHKLFSGIDKEH